jgi:hypothetical protein
MMLSCCVGKMAVCDQSYSLRTNEGNTASAWCRQRDHNPVARIDKTTIWPVSLRCLRVLCINGLPVNSWNDTRQASPSGKRVPALARKLSGFMAFFANQTGLMVRLIFDGEERKRNIMSDLPMHRFTELYVCRRYAYYSCGAGDVCFLAMVSIEE